MSNKRAVRGVRDMKKSSTWKPGSQPPTGYLAWHAWADAQHKAGLRQSFCVVCQRWKFPQEKCCGAARIPAKRFDQILKQNGDRKSRAIFAEMKRIEESK